MVPAIVLFGPPGAGKGTQARLLERYENVVHVSSGELARELPEGSDLYVRFTAALEETKRSGRFFPDELARDLLAHEIDRQGYGIETLLVLDGIPRTKGQVKLIDTLVDVLAVVELYAESSEPLIERMRLRAERAYDTDREAVQRRIEEYRTLTTPVLKTYFARGTPYVHVDALAGTPEEVHERMRSLLVSGRTKRWIPNNYKSI